MCLQDPSKSHQSLGVCTSPVCYFIMQAASKLQILLFEFLFEQVTQDPRSQELPSTQQHHRI